MATGVFSVEIPDSTVQSAVGALFAVPADRYAVVRAHVQNNESFLINGVNVLTAVDLDIIGFGAQTNGAVSQVVSSARIAHFQAAYDSAPGGTTLSIGGFRADLGTQMAIAAGVQQPKTFRAGPGHTISMAGSAASKFMSGYEIGRRNTSMAQVFRLKAGDTIQGGRYHLELYKIPGSAT